MASPENPLDVFVTYTYHFELHVAKDWESLKILTSVDANAHTLRGLCNGTLVINTRKDAHQVIDDVKFTYACPQSNSNGLFTPYGMCEMLITEPGGAQFVEKLDRKMQDLNVTTPSSLQWGLKIFFVGRLPGGGIETIAMPAIIPLHFMDMSANFSYKGAEYRPMFAITTSILQGPLGNGQPGDSSVAALSEVLAYSNKNISVKSTDVKDALQQLQTKLNDNYENVYNTELENTAGSRKLKYFINVGDGVAGKLSLISKDSFAPDDKQKLTFDPSQTILTWVNNVCRSSNDLNRIVGQSRSGIRQEGHPGVKLISVIPRLLMKNDCVELHYDIGFYEGGGEDLYTFDFMFAEPGKNVDVLNFDLKANSLAAWFAGNAEHGADKQINSSSTLPSQDPKSYSENTMTRDLTRSTLYTVVEKSQIPTKSGDMAYLNSMPRTEKAGLNKYEFKALPATRLMFSTIADAHGITDPLLTFTIRGHLDLLMRGIVYPDGSDPGKPPAGTKKPTQIKVNINSPDEGHPPFFYTRKYLLLGITNQFSGGKFIQQLQVSMQTAEAQA